MKIITAFEPFQSDQVDYHVAESDDTWRVTHDISKLHTVKQLVILTEAIISELNK